MFDVNFPTSICRQIVQLTERYYFCFREQKKYKLEDYNEKTYKRKKVVKENHNEKQQRQNWHNISDNFPYCEMSIDITSEIYLYMYVVSCAVTSHERQLKMTPLASDKKRFSVASSVYLQNNFCKSSRLYRINQNT